MDKNIHDTWTIIAAVLTAMLLASHQLPQASSFGVAGAYLYWLFRILIEAGCFFAVLVAVEKYFQSALPSWAVVVVSIVVSLVPFTLAIIAVDLVAGLPELGLNGAQQTPAPRVSAFALELLYLFDNHIALCLLLLIPRIISQRLGNETTQPVDTGPDTAAPAGDLFFMNLEPPLDGDICALEAQEHYVRISTTAESRMVLYRFSDAVKHIPDSLGMQVHRSHWVAENAVKGLVVSGQSMKVELQDGTQVPVSRTFRTAVEKRFKHVDAEISSNAD